jgi:hypothetical protein
MPALVCCATDVTTEGSGCLNLFGNWNWLIKQASYRVSAYSKPIRTFPRIISSPRLPAVCLAGYAGYGKHRTISYHNRSMGAAVITETMGLDVREREMR